jgi:EmrB/QacA subfamily drug resistance transporter
VNRTTSSSGLALAALAGALALDLSGLAVLNAALPAIGNQFGLAEADLQWVMTAYAVAFGGLLLPAGRAADALGRRRVFLGGVVLFTVAAAVGALAPTMEVLIAARAAQGIGAAMSGPAAIALLTQVFEPGPARNRALSIYGAVGAASFSGGMLLGGVLTDTLGWRSVLGFSAVLGLVLSSTSRALLPAGERQAAPLDLPGAVLVTAGMALAVVGVTHGGTAGWTDVVTILSLVLGAVAMLAFFLWERAAPNPMLPPSLLRFPLVRAGLLTAFLQYGAALGMLFFASLYLQSIWGFTPATSGLAVAPSSVAVALTSTFLAGPLLARHGLRPMMSIGLALIGLSSVLWLWTPLHGSYWIHVLPGLLVSGIGQGLAFPAMTAAAVADLPQRQHAVAGATNVVAQQGGASLGVAILVMIAATAHEQLAGYHLAYGVAAVACLCGAVVVMLRR